MKELNTIGRYLRKRFGVNVYKIPISISGFTCPNIDGEVAKGGCTFCENYSFSPNLEKNNIKFKLNFSSNNPYLELQLNQLRDQFFATKKKLQKKFNAKKFIVYFQSYTNTYAPLQTLKALYEEALSFEDVVGLSIGTRSDCVNDEILNYIASLNKQIKQKNKNNEIWIEYGIQSVYDETLKLINRGHDIKNVKEAIEKTKKLGIKVCGHLIFGLPNETKEMMLNSTKESVKFGIDSIKFHPMYITKNTALAASYYNKTFTPISEEDYIDVVVKSIKMLPDNIIIQRVTAGIDNVLAPTWCSNKHKQIYNIKEALKKENLLY